MKKLDFIRSSSAGVQVKLLLFQHMNSSMQYAARVFRGQAALAALDHVEDKRTEYFMEALDLPNDPNLTIPVHKHVQDGGLGLAPISSLRNNLFGATVNAAAEFVLERGLEPIRINDIPEISMATAWRKLYEQPNQTIEHPPWITNLPTTRVTAMTDDEMKNGVRVLLRSLRPRHYNCPLTNIRLHDLNPHTYTNHMMTCAHCGAPQFHIRHERIVYAITRVFKAHAIAAQANPKGYPIPSKTRGGPDVIVFAERTYALDVAVSENPTAAYTSKIRHYEEYVNHTGHAIVPIVVSTSGVIHRKTVEFFRQMGRFAGSTRLFQDVTSQVTAEVMRGIFDGINVLHARNLNDETANVNEAELQHATAPDEEGLE